MNLIKAHQTHLSFPHIYHIAPTRLSPPFFSLERPKFNPLKPPLLSLSDRCSKFSSVSKPEAASVSGNGKEEETAGADVAPDENDDVVYRKTLRLVECAMFAAVTGLVYFLSNSLAIENYFGCFFSLPIVISSIRWGIAAGRKTMVATAMLLFVLSGPVKALTYLLTHGLVGFTMGSLWRLGASWGLSVFVCTIVRSIGAMGYVLTSSFLIRENILGLITINIHTSISYIFAAVGLNTIPSMNFIYAIFGTVLLLNSGFFVFLLHLLYSVFLTRLGMKSSLRLPAWLEKAI